jgi:hypothetical protein
MVLRTIGYTDNASVLVGQWPANYIALGQNLNLYAKVSNDTQMNKASAAQMIYNVLTAQLVQVDANSTVSYLWDRLVDNTQAERTLLTTGLNCKALDDTVVTRDHAYNAKIDLVSRIGAYGRLYESKTDGKIVALTNVKTQFLTGRFFVESNGVVKFQTVVDGTKYNLSGDASIWAKRLNEDVVATVGSTEYLNTSRSAVFLNGNLTDLTDDLSDKYLYYRTSSTNGENLSAKVIVAADVNGLTISQLRSVAIWEASDTFLYESGQIDSDGKKFNGHSFPLDESNNVDHSRYVLAGVDSLDELAADNVIYVYKSDNIITRIDVGRETQSGVVTNVNLTDFTRTIGGKVLVTAPWTGLGFDEAGKAGSEGTALLDVYGRLYAFRVGDAFKGNFAVYLQSAAYFGRQAKIFDKTGKEVVYGTTSDVYREEVKDSMTGLVTVTGINKLPAANTLIEYKLSGSNISDIPTYASYGTAKEGHINASGTILSFPGSNPSKTPVSIDSGVLVYVQDGDKFSLGSIKDLVDDDLEYVFQYIVKDGSVKALLVQDGDAGAQNAFVMINSISQGWNDGDIDVVTGLVFADGANASAKSLNFNAADLQSKLDTAYGGFQQPGNDSYKTGYYSTMVKFKIGEDGVLKPATQWTLYDSNTADGGPAPIVGAEFGAWRSGGGDGSFSIVTTVSGVSQPIAFEANTVLYKNENGSWVAYKPAENRFKEDTDTSGNLNGRYTFLRTGDDKKTYDVIIKQP